MKRFTVVHHDAFIEGTIDETGHVTMVTEGIKNDEVLFRAIVRAKREGATRGTFFTGEIVNDDVERKSLKRAERGTTWIGGRVTRLADGEFGPCFRVDWDEFPDLTE